MARITILGALFAALLTGGCDMSPESGWGFTLPEGDPEAGERTFVELRCHDCHTIRDYDTIQQSENPRFSIPLGGKVNRISTYGELVTSIINPSHRISRRYAGEASGKEEGSPMRVYNDIMTIKQLSDLVMFLQDQYELIPYNRTNYRMYP